MDNLRYTKTVNTTTKLLNNNSSNRFLTAPGTKISKFNYLFTGCY